MNAFAPSGLVLGPGLFADLPWSTCRAFLAWNGDGGSDADRFYRDLVGRPPQQLLRNKFPTATFPCRSWASGTEDCWRYDLRLGVHGWRDEFEVAGQGVRPAAALGRLLQASRLLPMATLPAPSLHLDLELDGPDALVAAGDWAATLCPPADPTNAPQTREYAGETLVLRVAGELHEHEGHPLFLLRAEVFPQPGTETVETAALFARINLLPRG